MELDLPEDEMTRILREMRGEPKEPGQGSIDQLAGSQWLRALDAQVWQEHQGRSHRGGGRKYRTVYRKLTETEWDRVRFLIDEEGYLTMMAVMGFGFTCGMLVMEHPEPVYPGVPLEPKLVLALESGHLPQEEDRFEAGWRAFSPFTHNARNARWLEQYGMEKPQPKGHYEY